MATLALPKIGANYVPLSDMTTRLEIRRRAGELQELAASEGLALPMPAAWIATLELAGYAVDLQTGEWVAVDGVRYMPTEQALQMAARGELVGSTA